MSERKKLFIQTYGCQMNVYDSERMVAALVAGGYVETDSPEDADLVILNTCHIREKAAEKVYSDLGRLRPLRQAKAAAGRARTGWSGPDPVRAQGTRRRRQETVLPAPQMGTGPLLSAPRRR